MQKLCIAALLVLPVGCATYPDQIEPAYVAPATYSGLTCQQISAEMNRIKALQAGAASDQAGKATSDALWVGAAVVMPVSLLMLGAGQDHASEVASLKGHWNALYANYRDRECALQQPEESPSAP